MEKLSAQNENQLILGKKLSIQSNILHENRSYWLKLPENYQKGKEYPIILLLDAEMYFPVVAAIQSNLEKRNPEAESILIGVNNTNRTRDLTPSAAISSKGGATMENSGGGESFFRFIEEELFANIRKNYATSKRTVIIGHSFGALFGYFTLVKHAPTFSDYLLIEPSLWWDDGKWQKEGESLINTETVSAGKRVFWAFAGTHSPEKDSSFAAINTALKNKHTIVTLENFPKENHGSLFIPALYDGLRFIWNVPQIGHFPNRKPKENNGPSDDK